MPPAYNMGVAYHEQREVGGKIQSDMILLVAMYTHDQWLLDIHIWMQRVPFLPANNVESFKKFKNLINCHYQLQYLAETYDTTSLWWLAATGFYQLHKLSTTEWWAGVGGELYNASSSLLVTIVIIKYTFSRWILGIRTYTYTHAIVDVSNVCGFLPSSLHF